MTSHAKRLTHSRSDHCLRAIKSNQTHYFQLKTIVIIFNLIILCHKVVKYNYNARVRNIYSVGKFINPTK